MAGSRIQDEEMAEAPAERPARLRSTVTAVRKQKGRGFREDMDIDEERRGAQSYESLDNSVKSKGGQKCTSFAPLCEAILMLLKLSIVAICLLLCAITFKRLGCNLLHICFASL